MKFAALDGKRVAVWGFGREGRAALAALRRRLPGQPLTLFCNTQEAAALADTRDVEVRTQPPDAGALAAFDFIVKSPGISIYRPDIVTAQKHGTVFTSGTALWFGENPDARVVGITGTKGKSTTAALTAHLARAAGVRTALAGNIGMPLLELDGQKAALWVVELSSFQTGDAGPLDVGVVTSLYEDHLDWHGSRERYVADKLKLADVSRVLVVNATQSRLVELTANHPDRMFFGNPAGWHIADGAFPETSTPLYQKSPSPSFPRKRESSDFDPARQGTLDSRLRGNDETTHRGDMASIQPVICRADDVIVPLSILPVPGRHNALNACAALTALEQVGIDVGQVIPSLATFRPLPHRLQNLGRGDGLEWIDDSISTTPQAALAALDSLADRRVTLIVGGHDRGLDWSGFVQALAQRTGLRIVTQGANGPRIAAAMRAAGESGLLHEAVRLDDAVAIAHTISQSGDSIVLSPGAPSFDQFHDYTERGRHFADLAGFDGATLGSIAGLGIA